MVILLSKNCFECGATKWLCVVQRNDYFPHQEYALIAMLRDDNENVRNIGVAKHRKQMVEESANNNDCHHALNSSLINLFNVPTLNLKANAYNTTI